MEIDQIITIPKRSAERLVEEGEVVLKDESRFRGRIIKIKVK